MKKEVERERGEGRCRFKFLQGLVLNEIFKDFLDKY